MELTVKDNGQGFDPDQLEKGLLGGAHYGLAIMKERIESLGGQMLKFRLSARYNAQSYDSGILRYN